MALTISATSMILSFLEEHSDNLYKYVKSGRTSSPSNKCNTNKSFVPDAEMTDNTDRRQSIDKTGKTRHIKIKN